MRLLVLALAAALAIPVHAAMYKWVDAQGRVQYSDTPPPANARKAEEQKIVPNTIQTTGAPFAVQEAAKRNPVTVWMSDCGDLCNRAREYLARRGVPHSVRNPARQSEQEAWKQVSGGDNSVPLLVIGGSQKLKGFDEAQWSAALDTAGYPRNAPALKPQAIPSVEAPVVVKPAAPGAPQPAQGAQAAAPAK
ncbi:MAG: glutaredoxin family protein [Burkholderiales bacterium]|nr:glutaredoxin family protein [Burkholderiales bacterium]